MAENETSRANQSTEEGAGDKAKKWFGDISSDLFSIEVNTILSDNITAQKMPGPRHALLDIGKGYYVALEEMFDTCRESREAETRPEGAGNLAESEAEEAVQGEAEEKARAMDAAWQAIDEKGSYGSYAAFDAIRNQADSLIKDPDRERCLEPEQRAVLPRIKENSDLLKGMFNSLCGRTEAFIDPKAPGKKSLPKKMEEASEQGAQLSPNIIYETCVWISPEATKDVTNDYSRSELINKGDQISPLQLLERDLVLIRKVWELSTEVIVMQTSIQVDGDVISRLNSEYLRKEYFPQLRDYHDKGVDIALQHWSNLVGVAKELALALLETITK